MRVGRVAGLAAGQDGEGGRRVAGVGDQAHRRAVGDVDRAVAPGAAERVDGGRRTGQLVGAAAEPAAHQRQRIERVVERQGVDGGVGPLFDPLAPAPHPLPPGRRQGGAEDRPPVLLLRGRDVVEPGLRHSAGQQAGDPPAGAEARQPGLLGLVLEDGPGQLAFGQGEQGRRSRRRHVAVPGRQRRGRAAGVPVEVAGQMRHPLARPERHRVPLQGGERLDAPVAARDQPLADPLHAVRRVEVPLEPGRLFDRQEAVGGDDRARLRVAQHRVAVGRDQAVPADIGAPARRRQPSIPAEAVGSAAERCPEDAAVGVGGDEVLRRK